MNHPQIYRKHLFSPLFIDNMESVRKQIDDIFQPFHTSNESRAVELSLPLQVSETAENYRVKALVPGFSAENIHVDITGNVLSISAQPAEKTSQSDNEKEEELLILKEFNPVNIKRQIEFNKDIDSNNVSAQYDNGVLHLSIPKIKSEKSKTVTIQVNPQ